MRSLPGATIDDMYDYIKSFLKKAPDNVILHTGINEKQEVHQKLFLMNYRLNLLSKKHNLKRKFVYRTY